MGATLSLKLALSYVFVTIAVNQGCRHVNSLIPLSTNLPLILPKMTQFIQTPGQHRSIGNKVPCETTVVCLFQSKETTMCLQYQGVDWTLNHLYRPTFLREDSTHYENKYLFSLNQPYTTEKLLQSTFVKASMGQPCSLCTKHN